MYVLVLININNNPEFLQLIQDSLPLMPGWIIDSNALGNNHFWKKCPNETAKYFSFNLENKKFSWMLQDDNLQGEDYQVINSIEELSQLLEYVAELGETFNVVTVRAVPVPIIPKEVIPNKWSTYSDTLSSYITDGGSDYLPIVTATQKKTSKILDSIISKIDIEKFKESCKLISSEIQYKPDYKIYDYAPYPMDYNEKPYGAFAN
jgi:hypothetical protein